MSLALVTGAQGGIGLATARAFALAGHDVAIADLAVDQDGETLCREWGATQRVECFKVDVGDATAVEALFSSLDAAFGTPADILVNNAAVQFWSSLLDLSVADWEQTLRVNLTGAFLMTRQFARRRIARHAEAEADADTDADTDGPDGVPARSGGVIVNIGSGCNRLAFPNLVSYTASKGGLEMLTKVSALELGEYGIRVIGLAPGAIETERTAEETVGFADKWAALTPLGRIGQVADIADAVVALTGAGFRFVSGDTLSADGGLFSSARWPAEY